MVKWIDWLIVNGLFVLMVVGVVSFVIVVVLVFFVIDCGLVWLFF